MAHQLIRYLQKHYDKLVKDEAYINSMLVYHDDHYGAPTYLGTGTLERWQAAWLWLFRYFRDTTEFYGELAEPEPPPTQLEMLNKKETDEQYQRRLYLAADAGDWAAAWELLHFRREYEYEGWSEAYLTDVLQPIVEET